MAKKIYIIWEVPYDTYEPRSLVDVHETHEGAQKAEGLLPRDDEWYYYEIETRERKE